MADHDIQKSRHLLKRLEEEMVFLSTLVSQIDSLSSQVQYVSSVIKRTWFDIAKIYKDWIEHTENS
jgi:CII-binding regulator of phage lambda lysogenization HflD